MWRRESGVHSAPAPLPSARWSVRALPWAVLLLSAVFVLLRTWIVQSGANEMSVLRQYVQYVTRDWALGSVVILVSGAFLAVLFDPVRAGRFERQGWAWATWTLFLACVIPREENFLANGAADDEILIYLPACFLTLGNAWLADLIGIRGVLQLWVGLALVSLASIGAFASVGGHGIDNVMLSAEATAAVAGVLAMGTVLLRRLVSRRVPTGQSNGSDPNL